MMTGFETKTKGVFFNIVQTKKENLISLSTLIRFATGGEKQTKETRADQQLGHSTLVFVCGSVHVNFIV